LADTVFEELVSDMSFAETCNFLRSHAIRLDHQYKEKLQYRFTMLYSYPFTTNMCLKRYPKFYRSSFVGCSVNRFALGQDCGLSAGFDPEIFFGCCINLEIFFQHHAMLSYFSWSPLDRLWI
jgi:hypothetical protein